MINYSIIIPHYNTQNLLQRCLNSIPRREDIQIIVVDDNSDSLKVDFDHFPGMGEKGVEVYFTKEGKGAGYARNVGLQYARGKWLLFADADDYYFSGAFDVLDKELTEDLDILYFNVDSTIKSNASRASFISKKYEKYFICGDDLNVRFNIWTPWNKVFSHEMVKRKKLQFDEIPIGNDAFFALSASKYAKRYKIINNKLYCLEDNDGSITYTKIDYKRAMNYIKATIRINSFYTDNKHLYKFSHPAVMPHVIKGLYKDAGLKGLYDYCMYIHRNWSVLEAIKVTLYKLIIKLKG